MTSPSTTPLLSATTSLDLDADRQARCDVCAHDRAGHDAISLRYCQATQTNALSRLCICPKGD